MVRQSSSKKMGINHSNVCPAWLRDKKTLDVIIPFWKVVPRETREVNSRQTTASAGRRLSAVVQPARLEPRLASSMRVDVHACDVHVVPLETPGTK